MTTHRQVRLDQLWTWSRPCSVGLRTVLCKSDWCGSNHDQEGREHAEGRRHRRYLCFYRALLRRQPALQACLVRGLWGLMHAVASIMISKAVWQAS